MIHPLEHNPSGIQKPSAIVKTKNLPLYDIWGGGVSGYIEFMTERLRLMHNLLKPTGSLFVHLDWRMSHYIKIELDKIFGVKNSTLNNSYFKNEIIWNYGDPARLSNKFPQKYDSILFYSKSKKDNKFYPLYDDIPEYLYKRARKDKDGRLWVDQRLGVKGKILEKLRKEKRTFKTKTGGERLKQYLDEMKGKPLSNVWNLPIINSQSNERIGWPTQKPLALLQRIIKATTKENDLVADFFCGCGTAIDAAQSLNRRWIG